VSRRTAGLLAAVLALFEVACGGGATPPLGPVTPPVAATTPSPSPSSSPSSLLGADWPEYHRTAARAGLGPAAPALGNPKVAWNVGLDGAVYASPLIVAGHVLVATENNTVYSLDLFTGAAVWQTHLGDPIAASSLPCGDISPVTGITGTPAVDMTAGRLYVVAFIVGFRHVLFTVSLVDGKVLGAQDVDPPGSHPTVQQERGALALGSGYVYIPFGGLYGDCGQYNGYLVAVPLGGGTVLSYRVPSSREAGIWAASGPTIAASGSVYVTTGNGASLSTFDYSNSVVKLSWDLTAVQSFFAPSNWVSLNDTDTDLGSVGAALLPSLGVVVAVGKEGVAYLLTADQMGGIGGQIASQRVCSGAWGGMAWSGSTVFIPCADGLVALSVTSTTIGVAWKSAHPILGSPIVAAGAVWAIEPQSARLYAIDPSSGVAVYSTALGAAEHFSTPAATEGYVVAPAGTNVVAISTTG
jgi:outer membrane protein assembly factor BamB